MMTKLLCPSVWMVVLMFTVTDCSPHKWHLARFLYDKPSRAWQDNIIPLSPHDPLTLSHKTNIIRCSQHHQHDLVEQPRCCESNEWSGWPAGESEGGLSLLTGPRCELYRVATLNSPENTLNRPCQKASPHSQDWEHEACWEAGDLLYWVASCGDVGWCEVPT